MSVEDTHEEEKKSMLCGDKRVGNTMSCRHSRLCCFHKAPINSLDRSPTVGWRGIPQLSSLTGPHSRSANRWDLTGRLQSSWSDCPEAQTTQWILVFSSSYPATSIVVFLLDWGFLRWQSLLGPTGSIFTALWAVILR